MKIADHNLNESLLTSDYVRRRIKMRYLLLLVAIDDLRSVHKAAEAMNITQPAATKLLAEVERLLNVKLFDRTSRGVAPTLCGQAMLRHARSIMGSMDTACRELDAIRSGATGKICMGVVTAAGPVLLPRSINRLKNAYPDVTVTVKAGTMETLVPELRAGMLDMVIGRISDDRDGCGVKYEQLSTAPMRIVARTEHPVAKLKPVGLVSLASYPWIWPPQGSLYRTRIESAFLRAGGRLPTDLVESDDPFTNRALIKETDRLGIFPENVARFLGDGGGIIELPVDVPTPTGPLGLVLPNDRDPSICAQAMIDCLRTIAQELNQ
jgi:DNA-binding transcriptional LysR family regulator